MNDSSTQSLPAPVGELPTFTAEDWESHVSTALALIETGENVLWHLAAVCASVSTKYGDKSISKFASEIGYSARRVYEYAATYEAWRFRARSQTLSFKHHTLAARTSDPEKTMAEAEDEALSAPQLERRISGRPDEELERCPACNGRGRVPKSEVYPLTEATIRTEKA